MCGHRSSVSLCECRVFLVVRRSSKLLILVVLLVRVSTTCRRARIECTPLVPPRSDGHALCLQGVGLVQNVSIVSAMYQCAMNVHRSLLPWGDDSESASLCHLLCRVKRPIAGDYIYLDRFNFYEAACHHRM